jgi:hypothetical protein
VFPKVVRPAEEVNGTHLNPRTESADAFALGPSLGGFPSRRRRSYRPAEAEELFRNESMEGPDPIL